jgi:Uma2 family endonuclease
MSAMRGRKPDLSVYLPGRRPGDPKKSITCVPPDIAVEIVSPVARDQRRARIEKVADYAAFGVRWYWLVDPALRSFEILELGADGRYAHAVAATEQRLDLVPGCDGLAIDVPAPWAEIERLGQHDEP